MNRLANTSNIDRSLAPPSKPLKNFVLPSYTQTSLSNGISVYLVQYGSVPVVETQLVFRAGTGYEPKPGLASFTARNLTEGTQEHTGLEIAEKLDEYGSWLNAEASIETFIIKLASLVKHLPKTLPLCREVVFSPAFPQEEFAKLKTRTLQKLEVSEQKTNYMARRLFGHIMFGDQHPYGVDLGRPELDNISREELIQYHNQYIYMGNCFITVTGNFDEQTVLDLLEAEFGKLPIKDGIPAQHSSAITKVAAPKAQRHYKEMPGMQATIRLGHKGFNKAHPDYYKMEVVNTILGGYFGSRLMKNIREDKGYTYGIYSGWASYMHDGIFVVQGDVGNEYIESTITEVKKEIQYLIDEKVSQEELDTVKNYMLGKSISQRETLFQISNLLRFSVLYNMPFEEMDKRFDIIQSLTVEDVQVLAAKYLRPNELLEVVCGKIH